MKEKYNNIATTSIIAHRWNEVNTIGIIFVTQ